jgi:hypothetical protein
MFCITLFVLVGFGHGIKPTRANNVMQNTSKNVRQYHGQSQQGQTMVYKTHRRTSENTMAKTNKDKQCLSLLVLAMVVSDVLRCVLYNIVCPCWFWPWYCLTFFDVFCITFFVLVGFGHGNTNKDKQCNTKHIEERQTIPWPKPTRANNVMQNTSKNVRQYHGQSQQGQTMVYKTIVCPCAFWPWYCLTFFDVFCITLFVLVGFVHGIV